MIIFQFQLINLLLDSVYDTLSQIDELLLLEHFLK